MACSWLLRCSFFSPKNYSSPSPPGPSKYSRKMLDLGHLATRCCLPAHHWTRNSRHTLCLTPQICTSDISCPLLYLLLPMACLIAPVESLHHFLGFGWDAGRLQSCTPAAHPQLVSPHNHADLLCLRGEERHSLFDHFHGGFMIQPAPTDSPIPPPPRVKANEENTYSEDGQVSRRSGRKKVARVARDHHCSPVCQAFPVFPPLPPGICLEDVFEIRVNATSSAQQRPRLGQGGHFYNPSAQSKNQFVRDIRGTGNLPLTPLTGSLHLTIIFEFPRPLNDFRQ